MSSQIQVLNLRPLRSGGHGNLFTGQLSNSGAWVVVKFLREYSHAHERQAFFREIDVLARQLRGIVRLLGSDKNAPQPYYVMEYLDNGPLTQYVGRLTEEQLTAVANELALTLANFHATVGAHGDIKPDNILVSRDGQLRVADPLGNGFGFTVLFSQNHGGTPGYWAPEVRAKTTPISRAGDVYSYGATLSHLLTGRKPQDGEQPNPTAAGYVNAPKIRELITLCCDPNSAARPKMQDIVRILAGESWSDIQATRQLWRLGLGVACLIALVMGISRTK